MTARTEWLLLGADFIGLGADIANALRRYLQVAGRPDLVHVYLGQGFGPPPAHFQHALSELELSYQIHHSAKPSIKIGMDLVTRWLADPQPERLYLLCDRNLIPEMPGPGIRCLVRDARGHVEECY